MTPIDQWNGHQMTSKDDTQHYAMTCELLWLGMHGPTTSSNIQHALTSNDIQQHPMTPNSTYWMFFEFCWMLLDGIVSLSVVKCCFTGCCWVLLGVVGHPWVLLGVILGVIGCRWVSLGAVVGMIGCHWV